MLVSLDCVVFGLQSFGGISNYWKNIIDSNVDSSNKLELIYPRDFEVDTNAFGVGNGSAVKFERLPVKYSRYLDVFSSNKYSDVFHTSYYRLPIRKVRNRIVTVYDFTYEKFMNGIRREVHSRQKFRAIKNSDTIICISNSTKNDLLEYLPNIDVSLLHVVPLAVDSEKFHLPIYRKSDLADIVLFVGGRSKYKRFDLAIGTLSLLKNFRLGIIGPPLNEDEKTLLNMKLGNRWIDFGFIKSEDMHEIYGSVFAFLFPSDYEGFGLPVLEAMACGCPVICSRTSSLPEVGGEAAKYADGQDPDAYANAINFLESDSLRESMIELGLRNIKRFSWSETCRLTKALYAQ
jgi:mannosyltransferase